MDWFLLALLPPFFWSATGFIDQYLARKYFVEKAFTHICFSMLSYAIILIGIAVIYPDVFAISHFSQLIIMFIGTIFYLSLAPYVMAIQREDSSNALPLFQSIPFFTAIFGWIVLGETLTVQEIIAGFIIIIGGMGMLADFSRGIFSRQVCLLMLASSALVGLHMVLLRAVSIGDTIWITVTFWILFGRMAAGLVYFATVSNARNHIIQVLKRSRGRALLLDTFQNFLSFGATAALVLAMRYAPSSTHVMLVNGLEPFFLMMMSLMLGYVIPVHFKAHVIDRYLAYRLGFLIMIFSGLSLLLL